MISYSDTSYYDTMSNHPFTLGKQQGSFMDMEKTGQFHYDLYSSITYREAIQQCYAQRLQNYSKGIKIYYGRIQQEFALRKNAMVFNISN